MNKIKELFYYLCLISSSVYCMQEAQGNQPVRVRLKGQEILHFHDLKCTSQGYYDDHYDHCCLDDSPNVKDSTQDLGYHEISAANINSPKSIYTLGLGPCIGILIVGMGLDGLPKKAALMHEDYSTVEGSVSDIFERSFKSDLSDYSALKVFLIGGNDGSEETIKRFNIHESEIRKLDETHHKLAVDLVINTKHEVLEDYQNKKNFLNLVTDLYFEFREKSSNLLIIRREFYLGPIISSQNYVI